MSPSDQAPESIATIHQTTIAPSWTINVSDVRTVKISNVSQAVSENDIKEFFSFSGHIQYIEMRRESEETQVAYVTFKELQGADTAMLLSGATIADHSVIIEPVDNYQLPPEAFPLDTEKSPKSTNETAVKKAEDVVSTMLAKGYVLGKDAINKAKAFDEQHHLTSNASATVASLDRKMGLSLKLSIGTAVVNEKMREMDEKFQVSEKTKSVFAAAEQKASSAGSALMSNPYVSTGASWVSNAFSAVARAAEDVSTMTKEKVEKAEEEKKETLIKDSVEIINGLADNHQDDQSPTTAPPLVPIDSSDRKLGNI